MGEIIEHDSQRLEGISGIMWCASLPLQTRSLRRRHGEATCPRSNQRFLAGGGWGPADTERSGCDLLGGMSDPHEGIVCKLVHHTW